MQSNYHSEDSHNSQSLEEEPVDPRYQVIEDYIKENDKRIESSMQN